jgi:hypothetical protein
MTRIILIVLGIAATGGLGFYLGRFTGRDYRVMALREHSHLLAKARRASLRKQDGLANIYAEGAERVLELVERPDGSQP